MNTINIPGFTAEKSLTKSLENYQLDFVSDYSATTGASFYGGAVQPAQSDAYNPNDPPRVTPDPSRYHPRPVWCLKRTCLDWQDRPGQTPRCKLWVRSVGVWNPVTGFCE